MSDKSMRGGLHRAIVIAVAGLASAGCIRKPDPSAEAAAAPQVPAAPPKPIAKPRKLIGVRTQNIRDLEAERKNENVNVANQKITAKDPLMISGQAYTKSVAKISIQNIEYAIKLYQAEHDRYPADYEEFMNDIIKANNIALPQLPYYQEYAYDAKAHRLVVLEYPDRKAAYQESKRQGR